MKSNDKPKPKPRFNDKSKDECIRKVRKGKRNSRRKSKIKVQAKPAKSKDKG